MEATIKRLRPSLGGSDQPNDVVVSGGEVSVRAERSGAGNGRVYTIKATAVDQAGNRAEAAGVCTVPLNQSQAK